MAKNQPKIVRRLTIIRDTSEQLGFEFKHVKPGQHFDDVPIIKDYSLDAMDYSLPGWTRRVGVERKGPDDLVHSLTEGRDRLLAMFTRALEMDAPLFVIEAPESFYMAGHHHGSMSGDAIVQSVRSICQAFRMPYKFCKDREEAEQVTYDHLRHFWIHRAKNKPSFMERALLRDWTTAEEAAT